MKSLIAILFLVVGFSGNVWGQIRTGAYPAAMTEPEQIKWCEVNYAGEINKNEAEICKCTISSYRETTISCPQTRSEKKSGKASCEPDRKEWEKQNIEKVKVCASFKGVPGRTCEDQMQHCEKHLDADYGGSSSAAVDQVMGILTSVAQSSGKVPGGKSGNAACFKYTNQDIKQEKKDLANDIKEIKKDILEETKKINEKNADLRKEEAEIKVEQQKVNAELKKTIQKIETGKREKYNDYNKELQSSGVNIRKLNSAIIAAKQRLEKMKFENQFTMMQFTDDKVKIACKNEINKAKQCFVKAANGQLSSAGGKPAAEATSCKGYEEFSGQGTKGTGELRKRIELVKSSCFEQANTSISRTKYDYTEKISNAETEIKELAEQINDANKSLELSKQNFDSIEKESNTEKSDEEKSATEQMNNFNEKLQNLQKNTAEAIATSKSAIEDLQKRLNEATAIKLADSLGIGGDGINSGLAETITSSARGNLTSASTAASAAHDSCNCIDSKNTSQICKLLRQEESIKAKPSRNSGNGIKK